MANDNIANMLQFTNYCKAVYLGDSENDNSEFKEADNSIEIRNDDRKKVHRMQISILTQSRNGILMDYK
jgi:hypothetical protein